MQDELKKPVEGSIPETEGAENLKSLEDFVTQEETPEAISNYRYDNFSGTANDQIFLSLEHAFRTNDNLILN